MIPLQSEITDRYNASDWEIDPDSWLWKPSTKFAGLGDGFGTNKVRSSGPIRESGVLTNMDPATGWVHEYGRNCLKPDGTNDCVIIPNTHLQFGLGNFTASAWFKSSSLTYQHVIGNGTNEAFPPAGIYIKLRNNGHEIWWRTQTVDIKVLSLNWAGTGWHHVAYTRTNGLLRAFFDGRQVGTANGSTADATSVTGNYISSPIGKEPLNGSVADVLYLSIPLTLPQIRQLASRRPDMGGLIRSRHVVPMPVTTETPPAVTYRPMQFQVC